MVKINKLTQKQIDVIPNHIEKWINIGLSTEPINIDQLKEVIIKFYKILGYKKPQLILFVDSPFDLCAAGIYAVKFLDNLTKLSWHDAQNVLLKNIDKDQIENNIIFDKASLGNAKYNIYYGNVWIAYYTYIDYFKEYFNLNIGYNKFDLLKKLISLGHIFWFHESVCVISHKPKYIHRNARGLHNENGLALEYANNKGLYMLNGVNVPEWLVKTRSEDLDCVKILSLTNVEQRREGIRKIGIDKIFYHSNAKLLDEKSFTNKSGTFNYKLYRLSLGDNIQGTCLKFENASIPELWHVEFVPNDIISINQAINFRNNLTEEQIDDINGADYYQQGDVIIKPKGQTKFKRFPVLLT